MTYKLSFSFVMDEPEQAELLALQVYALIQKTERLWALSGQLLSDSEDPKAPINVVLSHADMEAKPTALMYGRDIDPVQMPSSIRLTCTDPQGGFSQLIPFAGGNCKLMQYMGMNARFQVEIELDKGVKADGSVHIPRVL